MSLWNLAGNPGLVSGLLQFVTFVLLGFGLLLSLLVPLSLATFGAWQPNCRARCDRCQC